MVSFISNFFISAIHYVVPPSSLFSYSSFLSSLLLYPLPLYIILSSPTLISPLLCFSFILCSPLTSSSTLPYPVSFPPLFSSLHFFPVPPSPHLSCPLCAPLLLFPLLFPTLLFPTLPFHLSSLVLLSHLVFCSPLLSSPLLPPHLALCAPFLSTFLFYHILLSLLFFPLLYLFLSSP